MNELIEGRILAVDDEEAWRGIFGRNLAAAGIEHEVVDDPDIAMGRLEADEFTGVITDGLEGRWVDVYSAANIAQTAIVVISGNFHTIDDAKRLWVEAYNKNDFDLQMFQEIVRSLVLPS